MRTRPNSGGDYSNQLHSTSSHQESLEESSLAKTSSNNDLDHQELENGKKGWWTTLDLDTNRDEWWAKKAKHEQALCKARWNESMDSRHSNKNTGVGSIGRHRRKCTNPICAFLFINVIAGYLVVLAYLVCEAPTWRRSTVIFCLSRTVWLRLQDSEGHLCGGAGFEDHRFMTHVINLSAWDQTPMPHRTDGISLLEWVQENPVDWTLAEEAFLLPTLFTKKCVRSCATTETLSFDIFPSILDCDESDDERTSSNCLSLPLGNSKRPLLGSLCYSRSNRIQFPLQHPLVLDALQSSFSWIYSLMKWVPFRLSEASLNNLMDVVNGSELIPIAMFIAFTLSLSLLVSMRYISRPAVLILIYLLPMLFLGMTSYGFYCIAIAIKTDQKLKLENNEAWPGDSTPLSMGVTLAVGGAVGAAISTCFLYTLKSKVKAVLSVSRAAAVFCNNAMLAVVPSIVASLLSLCIWAAVLVGIVARVALADFDESKLNLSLEVEPNTDSLTMEGVFSQRFSVTWWIIISIFIGVWSMFTLRGYARIAVAMMVHNWTNLKVHASEREPSDHGTETACLAGLSLSASYEALHHFGTACVGGCVIAITSSLRYIVKWTLQRLESSKAKLSKEGGVTGVVTELAPSCCSWHKCLTKVMKWLRITIAIIDRFTRFITDQSYIHTALLNRGFFKGCFTSFTLMLNNGGTVLSVVLVTRIATFTAMLITSSLSTGFVMGCSAMGLTVKLAEQGTYLYVVCFVCSWFISKSIFSVNTSAVDTVLHLRMLSDEQDKTTSLQQV